MSAAIVAAQIVHSPAHDIKRKFFDTIGIAGTSSSESSSQDTAASNDMAFSRCHGVTVFQEKLKFDSRNDSRQQNFSSGSTNACRHRTSKKGKCLTFNENVEVVPIPMRNEYSTRVRSRLWSGAVELHENAVRNTIEFASEGWDWRNVLEDDGMYVCAATSELIHPCHYTQPTLSHGFR